MSLDLESGYQMHSWLLQWVYSASLHQVTRYTLVTFVLTGSCDYLGFSYLFENCSDILITISALSYNEDKREVTL